MSTTRICTRSQRQILVPARRAAYDVKAVHRHLTDYADDDLKRIPIVPPGNRLAQGSTYINLAERQPREISATAEMSAGEDGLYVAKSDVDYQLWNRLIGVRNPERLGE